MNNLNKESGYLHSCVLWVESESREPDSVGIACRVVLGDLDGEEFHHVAANVGVTTNSKNAGRNFVREHHFVRLGGFVSVVTLGYDYRCDGR